MVRDVWGHERRYKRWKEEISETGVEGLTKENSDILIKFVFDMEIGANISNRNKKGGRSYPRLNNIKQRLSQIMRMLEQRGMNDIAKVSEKEITQFFSDMRNGAIKTSKGKNYKSAADYIRVFNSFWRWYMKANKKKGIIIPNIIDDLDTSDVEKREFVWLKKEELDKMLPYFEEDDQVILLFVFDSIIRSPGELLNLKGKDVFQEEGDVWVNIPEKISKTFERSFNLLFCGETLLKYIERKKIQQDDYLFNFSPPVFTRKMQKVAKQLFGYKISDPRAGEYYKNITLYDLRHSGAIFLRIKAKENPKDISLDAIRHRGGWVDFDMLNYYTQLIGLDGKIDKQGLLIKQDRTQLEKDINALNKDYKRMHEAIKITISINKMLLEAATKDRTIKKDYIKRLAEMHRKGEAAFQQLSQYDLNLKL